MSTAIAAVALAVVMWILSGGLFGAIDIRTVTTKDGSTCYVLVSVLETAQGFSCVGNAVKAPPRKGLEVQP